MQSTEAVHFERKVWGICLIGAPLLMALGTFFWQGGRLGVVGGTIQVYAAALWIPALLGLYGLLRDRMPRFAVLGGLLSIYASLGGNNFGMDGIYGGAFRAAGASDAMLGALPGAMGLALPLTLLVPGIFFPLNLLILGLALGRAKVVPTWWAGLLCLGAVAFPASRIPRIELLAHVADLLLLVPLVWLGWRQVTQSNAGTASELAARGSVVPSP